MEPLNRKARPGLGFPPWTRLHKGADFRAVFENRCCSSEGWLAVHGRPNGLAYSRFGSSVGKRLVGNNIRRNRVRRMLREAIRLTRGQMPSGLDLVLTSRRGGIPQWDELLATLPKLVDQVRLRLEARALRKPRPGSEGR